MKKTKYIWAITLVIAGLVIASAASIPASTTPKTSGLKIEKSDQVPQMLQVQTQVVDTYNYRPQTLDTNPVFAFEDDQLHPAFGRTISGLHMAAYRDEGQSQIIWTYSADDGETYYSGVYYDMGGDYPSIKLWDGTRCHGTHVTDPMDLSGGPTYLFTCADPTETGSYEMIYWDWSQNGWHDMIDADIACDNSQNEHEFGFSTYVTSTTYGSGYTNGPTVTYRDPDDPNSGWIAWYYYDNCAHTDIDIDHTESNGKIWAYGVYDQDELLNNNWRLLVRVKDFVTAHQGADSMYTVSSDGNLQYPAIAAQEGNIVILAETDVNQNQDIICLYGTSVAGLQESFVADSQDDETFPDVRHVEGTTFVCSFVKNEKLYKSVSDDAGATWSTPEEVDDCENEYKTADITDFGRMAMYEKMGEDVDIWLDDDFAPEVQNPILEITIESGFGIGVSATIANTGTGAATNVNWTMTVTGGILGFINKTVSDTISSIAVDGEESIGSGMIIGLGAIDISVTADCDEGASDSATGDGIQLLIFSKVN